MARLRNYMDLNHNRPRSSSDTASTLTADILNRLKDAGPTSPDDLVAALPAVDPREIYGRLEALVNLRLVERSGDLISVSRNGDLALAANSFNL